jgi:hypothetical protein
MARVSPLVKVRTPSAKTRVSDAGDFIPALVGAIPILAVDVLHHPGVAVGIEKDPVVVLVAEINRLVGTGIAVDPVAAGPALQGVVARAALQAVVAGQAREGVVARANPSRVSFWAVPLILSLPVVDLAMSFSSWLCGCKVVEGTCCPISIGVAHLLFAVLSARFFVPFPAHVVPDGQLVGVVRSGNSTWGLIPKASATIVDSTPYPVRTLQPDSAPCRDICR